MQGGRPGTRNNIKLLYFGGLVLCIVLVLLFSTGCQYMKNETTDTISNTLEAQDLEGMKQKIKAGFQQEEYPADKSIKGYNRIGEKTKFKLSKYKKGNSYHLILEFSCEDRAKPRPYL